MTLEQFCRAVYTIGTQFHGSVTSWGRTPQRTLVVGGFAGDPHTNWVGVDMVYDTGPNNPAVDVPATALQLRVIHERTHDHYQPADLPGGPVVGYAQDQVTHASS